MTTCWLELQSVPQDLNFGAPSPLSTAAQRLISFLGAICGFCAGEPPQTHSPKEAW